MKRDATGKFTSNWKLEAKRRVSVTLTNTAWRLLEKAAKKYGISRSEVIERTARSFATVAHPSNAPLQLQALIWEQQQTITSLQRQQQDLEALLENAPDAIARFDSELRYLYMNRVVEQALGISRNDLLGKTMQTVLSDPICLFWEEHLREVFATAQEREIEFEFETPFGMRFYQARLVPELAMDGSPTSVIVVSRDMTATKQIERQHAQLATAQETERQVSAILESITDAFVAFDRNWCYTYVNQAAAKILQKPPIELLGKQIWDEVFPELVGGATYQHLHRAVEEQVPVSWEEWEQPLQRWLEVKAYPSDEGVALYFRDITERKRLAAELQEQKQQFKMLADNAPDIIARFDAEFRHIYVSPSVERAIGLPTTALIGKTNAELGLPADLCAVWHQGLAQVFATGQEQQIEFQCPTPRGSRWYQSRLVPEFAGNDGIKSVLGITRDFDDYKRTEQALRQSEERLRFALEAAEMAAWEWNLETGQVVRSHTAYQILGLDPDAPSKEGAEFLDLIHPDDRGSVLGLLEQAIAQRSFYSAEFRLIKPDGSLRWMFDQGRVICNKVGDVVRMSGVIQDITERKQVEFALRESELKFRTLADTMPQLFWVTRPDGYHEYFNQRWFEYTGMTLEETQGWGWHHLLHPDDRQRSLEVWKECLRTGNNYTIEYRFQRACDREYRWFLGLAFPLRNAEGEIIKWFGSCTDIHDQQTLLEERDRALAQEQTARQQAEAANRIKDEFLAMLSHELRTPLNPILGWSCLLKQGRLNASKTTAALETIERNARLQIQLIDDLLDISRILQGKLSLSSTPVDLKTTITAAIETVQLAAEAKAIHIQTQFASEVSPVLADPARLQQVIWNLLANAVKFTPETGQIQVRLTTTRTHAQIQVTDTGQGIRPDFLPHVFETFRQADSTITRIFGGLGLGLAIARHIVELHGGTIQAESPGEGQGATFTIKLPLLPIPTISEQEAILANHTLALQETQILAVDDEIDNLELAAFILEQAGASVVAVSSAQEALQSFRQAKPDILLADIGMPQMDGYTLLRQIRTLEAEQGDRPIPAIALTAYASEADQQQALAAGFQRHIPKPVEPEVLLQTILGLLRPS